LESLRLGNELHGSVYSIPSENLVIGYLECMRERHNFWLSHKFYGIDYLPSYQSETYP